MSAWMVESLIASTLLMALVMGLRRPVAYCFGPRVAYLLWLLPAVRMILPPLPKGGAAAAVLPDSAAYVPVIRLAGDVAAAAPAGAAAYFPWVEMLMALWFMGAMLFLCIQFSAYARFCRLMLAAAEPVARAGKVRIVRSPLAGGPIAFGIIRKYVVLPMDFVDRYEADEQDMAIAHELTHHRRGDLDANMAALLILGLHWCNPVAWIAYRAFRADQELACDALVIAGAGERRHAYGRAILKAASGRQFSVACHLNTIDNLKGRLKMLSAHGKSLRRISWGMAAVAVTTISGLALTASGSRAAQEVAGVSGKVADAKLVKLASFLPMPVQPPEPPRPPEAIKAPEPPLPPVPPAPPAMRRTVDSKGKGAEAVVQDGGTVPDKRRIIRHGSTDDPESVPGDKGIAAVIPDIHVQQGCAQGREMVRTEESRDIDGRRQQVRIMICGRQIAQQARAEALRGLGQARAELARDSALVEGMRAKILADIDRQIARMRAEGN